MVTYIRLSAYRNNKMDKQALELEVNLLHERVCSALSDTTRIMILYLLDEGDHYVNEIAEALEAPQSTISRRIIQSLDLMRAIQSDQLHAQAAITNPANSDNKTKSVIKEK